MCSCPHPFVNITRWNLKIILSAFKRPFEGWCLLPNPPNKRHSRKTSWMTWLFDTVCVFSCLEHSSNLSWVFTTWLVLNRQPYCDPSLPHFVGKKNHPNSSWMLITISRAQFFTVEKWDEQRIGFWKSGWLWFPKKIKDTGCHHEALLLSCCCACKKRPPKNQGRRKHVLQDWNTYGFTFEVQGAQYVNSCCDFSQIAASNLLFLKTPHFWDIFKL